MDTAQIGQRSALKGWDSLQAQRPALFSLVAGLAAFSAYFSMYAFRKPIGAAQYAQVAGWDYTLGYKSALLIAQVLGYALSKAVGIKVIAEMGRARRGLTIIALIMLAWVALIGFALVPAPWNIAFLLLNGFPLGLIWGLVFSYLEGRRTSDLLGAMLCASFIVSSGVVKSVGGWLLLQGVSEFWMPAATGALFFPLLFASVWLLEQLPPPDAGDEAARTPRVPMNAGERAALVKAHGLLLIVLVLAYLLVSALRDFRDNFAAELWAAMGYAHDPALFSASELPIGAIVLVTIGAIVVVRNNRRALAIMNAVIMAGMALLAGSTFAFQAGMLGPLAWMILSGLGLYLAYTPFNAMLFDRMIALFGKPGNAGFLIYIGDAAGYAASVALLLYRSFGAPKLAWLNFYIAACYAIAAMVALCMVVALLNERGRTDHATL